MILVQNSVVNFDMKLFKMAETNFNLSSRMKCITIPVATRHRQALPLPIPLPPAPSVAVSTARAPLRVAVRVVAVRVGEVRRRRARGVARISADVPTPGRNHQRKLLCWEIEISLRHYFWTAWKLAVSSALDLLLRRCGGRAAG